MVTADGLTLATGVRLPLRAWLPAEVPIRGMILALHGFNDHAGAWASVGPSLAARGWAVYAPDQRGFGRTDTRGRWAGAQTLIDDARAAITVLSESFPGQPLYVMGESMGGAVTIAALAGDDPAAKAARAKVSGAILSAPAVWARATMPWHYRAAMWLVSHAAPWLRLSGKGLERYPSDNIPVLRGLSVDPLWVRASRADAISGVSDVMDRAHAVADGLDLPTLLLYGLNDQIIPAPPVRAVANRLAARGPEHRLAIYREGWHMLPRDLDGARVVDDIAAWLDDPAGALPSGADGDAPAFLDGTLPSSDERGDHQSPWTRWNALTEAARAQAEAAEEARVRSVTTPGE
jgi:alpha-beta hydrolase superfamily lysophospholipase